MFVCASGAVRSDAVAELDSTAAEVVSEGLEFVGGGLTVLVTGPGCSAALEELVVVVKTSCG